MDELTKWRVEKIQQFEWIHQESLHFCFILRGSAWKEVGLHEPEIDQRAHFCNWFYDGFENTENYPLRDDELYKQRLELRFDNPHYGVFIASQCLFGAHWVKNMKENTVDFREDLEFFIDHLQQLFGIYFGYQLAIYKMKAKKRTSGSGQQRAMERRIKAIEDRLLPLCEDGIVRIGKGEFHQILSHEFVGSEKTPRDPKTAKTYKEKIEQRNKIEIILEKGTFLPD